MSRGAERKYRPVRTPMVLQMEAVECGAAALGINLEYHGRFVPLDVLRDDCGVSRDGSNAYYIKEAAKRYGLEVKAFLKPAEGLSTRQPPFIVFWQWNHFLVVEGFARGKVYINDPASGRRTIGDDEFQRGYCGIAFTFEPGPHFTKQGRRPSAVLGLIRRLSTSKEALGFVILAGLDDEAQCLLGGRQPPDQPQDGAGPAALLGEVGTRLEGERDAAVTALEFVVADGSPATCRIIDVDLPPRESLDDEKVVPLPEDNERRLTCRQALG